MLSSTRTEVEIACMAKDLSVLESSLALFLKPQTGLSQESHMQSPNRRRGDRPALRAPGDFRSRADRALEPYSSKWPGSRPILPSTDRSARTPHATQQGVSRRGTCVSATPSVLCLRPRFWQLWTSPQRDALGFDLDGCLYSSSDLASWQRLANGGSFPALWRPNRRPASSSRSMTRSWRAPTSEGFLQHPHRPPNATTADVAVPVPPEL